MNQFPGIYSNANNRPNKFLSASTQGRYDHLASKPSPQALAMQMQGFNKWGTLFPVRLQASTSKPCTQDWDPCKHHVPSPQTPPLLWTATGCRTLRQHHPHRSWGQKHSKRVNPLSSHRRPPLCFGEAKHSSRAPASLSPSQNLPGSSHHPQEMLWISLGARTSMLGSPQGAQVTLPDGRR